MRTEQYDGLIHVHLNDTQSFKPLPSETIASRIEFARLKLQRALQGTLATAERTIQARASQYAKYLKSWTCCELPKMYGLIKVNKTPVAVTTIVTCQHWLTTGLSQVCAYELNLLTAQHLPHVLKSPPELTEQLQTFQSPVLDPNALSFVTADVVGL